MIRLNVFIKVSPEKRAEVLATIDELAENHAGKKVASLTGHLRTPRIPPF